MKRLKKKSLASIERLAVKMTKSIGSTESLVIHTMLFIGSFVLIFLGVSFEKILLIVTTIVSLEAIYLSIFIQMSVNRQYRKLHAVARDVGEIQEDIEEIEKDVDEIQKDVEEIQEEGLEEKKEAEMGTRIDNTIDKLIEIEEVMEQKKQEDNRNKK